ncbi:MAG: malonyl-ACP O-methyltransferase BioC [Candidatus Gastranaerophilales bacterium]|nr:malonyl-ACP O-methyltransferase BioC [Candidatus Gastranaerophilales bacterium]
MQAIDKELIKKRFQRSLKTYDDEAIVQKGMASSLIDLLTGNAGNKFNKILEIGCGTGNLTRQIVHNLDFQEFITNDIVEESDKYVQNISDRILFTPGDAETIDLSAGFDLIVSNASFQWMSDLPEFLKKLHSCINKDGILAFTSFSPDNFGEISQLTDCKLDYYSQLELIYLINDYFEPIYINNEKEILSFNSPLEVLEHVKQIGVNALNLKFWTKKDLNEFQINYVKYFSDNGKVNLTYCPDYYILKAK